MAETVSEARVAETIAAAVGNLQLQMPADLRTEFSATAVAAESRLTEVQKEMSDDLRKEFDATRAFASESLDSLKHLIDVAIRSSRQQMRCSKRQPLASVRPSSS